MPKRNVFFFYMKSTEARKLSHRINCLTYTIKNHPWHPYVMFNFFHTYREHKNRKKCSYIFDRLQRKKASLKKNKKCTRRLAVDMVSDASAPREYVWRILIKTTRKNWIRKMRIGKEKKLHSLAKEIFWTLMPLLLCYTYSVCLATKPRLKKWKCRNEKIYYLWLHISTTLTTIKKNT